MTMHYCNFFVIILFVKVLLALSHTKMASMEYGLLAYESPTDKENLCVINFKDFSSSDESEAVFYFLQDESSIDWCDEQFTRVIKNKVVLINSGNCSISTQIANIYDKGGKGILIITKSEKLDEYYIDDTVVKRINISVALIDEDSAESLKGIYPIVSVCFFADTAKGFDFGLLVTFIIELLTIIVGSYWSGHVRFAIYWEEINSLSGNPRQLPNEPKVIINPDEESFFDVSPSAVGIFVCGMIGLLLILYNFISYSFYFINLAFFLGSTMSVYFCLKPFFLKHNYRKCQFRICKIKIDARKVLLVLFAFTAPVYWLITRNQAQSWILQNILGLISCIILLKSFRLPSFEICTILLVLLLIYDVFFVFVTPFLSRKGVSIMVELATGGGNFEEILPVGLVMPYLGFDSISDCYQDYSFFGFGDIVFPGLLVSYCHGFDLVTNKRKIYFLTTTFAYAIGSIMTIVVALLMNTAQPALLYLVPCTLIPPVVIAWRRKEFSSLWTGYQVSKQSQSLIPLHKLK